MLEVLLPFCSLFGRFICFTAHHDLYQKCCCASLHVLRRAESAFTESLSFAVSTLVFTSFIATVPASPVDFVNTLMSGVRAEP